MVLLLDLRDLKWIEVEEINEETKLEDTDLRLLFGHWLVSLLLNDGNQKLENLLRLFLVLLAVSSEEHLFEVTGLHQSVLVLDVAVESLTHLIESSVVDIELEHLLDDLDLLFEFFFVFPFHYFLDIFADKVRSQLHWTVTFEGAFLEGVEWTFV